MKRSLLYVIGLVATLVIAPGFSANLYADPCSVSNITVKLNSSTPSGGNCILNFDLSWDQDNNGGNKFTNIHLWTAAAYPFPALTYGSEPTALQLQNSLGTIVILNPKDPNPTLGITYLQAGTVIILSATGVQKVLVSGSKYRFTVTGISVTIPSGCSSSASIKADLWSSQATNDNVVHCFTTGSSFVANDPSLNGSGIVCSNPRQFTINLSTIGGVALSANYTVYADMAPFGTLDATDTVIYTTLAPVTIPASGSYNSGVIPFFSASGSNLWVRVQVTGFPFSTSALLTNTCGILPVKLASFIARRTDHSSVSIKWQTTMEQNNKGFEVMRKDGSGNFRSVGFVASKSADGNSNIALDYQFADANSYSGETQYRLKQIDFDGKVAYSSIVMVRGDGATEMSVLIYPNPSYSDNAVVVFSSPDKKDISITDVSGRMVRSVKGITAGNYALNGMLKGIYFVKVSEQESGKTVVRKLIIK